MNDNDDGDQLPTPRTLRMAETIRFWIDTDVPPEQMAAKLALQYPEATPSEIEHATLLVQCVILKEEKG